MVLGIRSDNDILKMYVGTLTCISKHLCAFVFLQKKEH